MQRVQHPGRICDNLFFLGSRSICLYLALGRHYALIGGGTPWVVARIEAQLDEHRIDRSRLRYLVISHAHHDHCGAVPYLMRRYPQIEVIASEFCATVFDMPKQAALIRDINRRTLDVLKKPHEHDGIALDFDGITVSRCAGDGDRLDLGGLTLMFINTPGHSKCSLTTYIPEMETLFPGDALPFPEGSGRELTVTANHDYNDYLQSLEKLSPLVLRRVCLEHGGVFEGGDVKTLVSRGLAATRQQRERIQKRYAELQDMDALIAETAGKYSTLELFRLVPPDILKALVGRMVRSALDIT